MIDKAFEPELYAYTSGGKSLHILVVDDSRAVRTAIRERLELAGLEVTEANCGEQALAMVAKKLPDLVLLDTVMRGMDGITVLKTLRASYNKYQLPIIPVTAAGSSSDIVQALDFGANDYVTKPIDFDVLWARLSNQLMQRQAAEYLRYAQDSLEQQIRQRTAELNSSNRKLKRVIQERLLAENRLQRQANYDALTGLPNRSLARDRLGQTIAKARRQNLRPCVAFLDLDDFKHVNDSLGHAAGDALLKQAARRLSGCTRKSDTVARLGGDEFLMILEDTGEQPNDLREYGLQRVGERIIEAFSTPFLIEDKQIQVSPSVGFALYPRDGEDGDELVRHADAAMYRAKKDGKNSFCAYSSQISDNARSRARIALQMRHAFEREAFSLRYQPVVATDNGAIVKAEASLCWKNTGLDKITADGFAKVAADAGLHVVIGDWIIRRACAQVSEWRESGAAPMTVVVKLNSAQLQPGSGLCQSVRDALREHRLPAEALQLEVAEDALMRDAAAADASIAELEKIGVRMILDEFGTGNVSISCLQRYRFDSVKIGGSVVERAVGSARDAELATAILAMLGSLDLTVVAAGIDTRQQRDFLISAGCRYAQGLAFSNPLPAKEFEDLLKRKACCPGETRNGGVAGAATARPNRSVGSFSRQDDARVVNASV